MNIHYLESPIGTLRLVSNGRQLTAIEFDGWYGREEGNPVLDDVLSACALQMTDYFAARRTAFDLPLAPRGTPFQHSVWTALAQIPYGESRSYRDIARAIGNPAAVRAVGAANGRNPIPIVVPCHRVIGSNGALTGYAGGLGIKTYLLGLEGAMQSRSADWVTDASAAKITR